MFCDVVWYEMWCDVIRTNLDFKCPSVNGHHALLAKDQCNGHIYKTGNSHKSGQAICHDNLSVTSHPVNPWCVIYFEKTKNITAFSTTCQHYDGTVSWNSLSCKARARLPYIANTMAVGDLVSQAAKTPAVILLSSFFGNIPTSASSGFANSTLLINPGSAKRSREISPPSSWNRVCSAKRYLKSLGFPVVKFYFENSLCHICPEPVWFSTRGWTRCHQMRQDLTYETYFVIGGNLAHPQSKSGSRA